VGEEKKEGVENQPKSCAALDKLWQSASPNSSDLANSLICVLIYYSTLFAPSSLVLISSGNNYGPIQKVQVSMLQCPSKKDISKQTIRIHFRENLLHLNNLRASGTDLGTLEFVENCHYELTHLLSSLSEESQATRPPGSPYPDSEFLLFYVFNHLLICFDLADAPIDLPSFSGGVFRDGDAMSVDDDCK
jgi:hypothetical protein